MRAAVVERDPLAGVGVVPDDEVAVEELERGGHARVQVLHERDRVPSSCSAPWCEASAPPLPAPGL